MGTWKWVGKECRIQAVLVKGLLMQTHLVIQPPLSEERCSSLPGGEELVNFLRGKCMPASRPVRRGQITLCICWFQVAWSSS